MKDKSHQLMTSPFWMTGGMLTLGIFMGLFIISGQGMPVPPMDFWSTTIFILGFIGIYMFWPFALGVLIAGLLLSIGI